MVEYVICHHRLPLESRRWEHHHLPSTQVLYRERLASAVYLSPLSFSLTLSFSLSLLSISLTLGMYPSGPQRDTNTGCVRVALINQIATLTRPVEVATRRMLWLKVSHWSVQYTVWSVQHTVWSVQNTISRAQNTISSVQNNVGV